MTGKIRRALEAPNESDPRKTVADAIVEAMIRDAMAGDFQMIKLLVERCDGRIPDPIQDPDDSDAMLPMDRDKAAKILAILCDEDEQAEQAERN